MFSYLDSLIWNCHPGLNCLLHPESSSVPVLLDCIDVFLGGTSLSVREFLLRCAFNLCFFDLLFIRSRVGFLLLRTSRSVKISLAQPGALFRSLVTAFILLRFIRCSYLLLRRWVLSGATWLTVLLVSGPVLQVWDRSLLECPLAAFLISQFSLDLKLKWAHIIYWFEVWLFSKLS